MPKSGLFLENFQIRKVLEGVFSERVNSLSECLHVAILIIEPFLLLD